MIETLSDKRFETPRGEALPMIIDTTYKEEDVKEFIKQLKEFVDTLKNDYYDYRDMNSKIDKLAGDKLIRKVSQ